LKLHDRKLFDHDFNLVYFEPCCALSQMEDWLLENLPAGSRVGFDPYVTPVAQFKRITQLFASQPAEKGAPLVRCFSRSLLRSPSQLFVC
jgi:hypothetical protein